MSQSKHESERLAVENEEQQTVSHRQVRTNYSESVAAEMDGQLAARLRRVNTNQTSYGDRGATSSQAKQSEHFPK